MARDDVVCQRPQRVLWPAKLVQDVGERPPCLVVLRGHLDDPLVGGLGLLQPVQLEEGLAVAEPDRGLGREGKKMIDVKNEENDRWE